MGLNTEDLTMLRAGKAEEIRLELSRKERPAISYSSAMSTYQSMKRLLRRLWSFVKREYAYWNEWHGRERNP